MSRLKIGVCQMQVQRDPAENLERALMLVKRAASEGAEVIALPEMFTIPYNTKMMKTYAQRIPGTISTHLAEIAKKRHILLIAGSVPELGDDGLIYNTCMTFSPDGALVSKYRKMHLFDIDIKVRTTFKESDVLSAGQKLTIIKYGDWTISEAICYDVRFCELFRLMADEGVQLVVIPASFSAMTGEMHWDLMMRTRAVDNQMYLAAVSTARNHDLKFESWGHSMIADPWGRKLAEAGEEEEILYATLDSEDIDQMREQLPLLKQRRSDMYAVEKRNIETEHVIIARRQL